MLKKLLLVVCILCLVPILALGEGATVKIAGKEYDASLEKLDLTKVKITDVAALEEALAKMPNLTYVDMSFCGIKNEEMAQLRARWAEKGVKIVWTLKFDSYTLRTDATAFSTQHSSNSKRLGENVLNVIQYATELQALDLGHNWMFDISWIEPLRNLRVLVLSDNRITDISYLEGMPLEYFEMFNNRVKDISCLANCETLIDLNLCNTHVADLTPLHNLPNLKRVWMGDIDELKQSEIDAFLEKRKDDLEAYNFFTKYPTEYGWRIHDRYEVIKFMFKEGAYYDFNTVLTEDQYVYLWKDRRY